MSETVFQRIFQEIYPYFPEGWEKAVFYAEYGYAAYSMSFYAKVGKDYIKCYDLENAHEKQLLKSFRNIDKFLEDEQKKNGWTNMTMIVRPDGKMKAEFDYTDLSEISYEYSKVWKRKYLK